MKVLVTGSNGFIGSHMCKVLLEKKQEVIAMVRKTSDLKFMKQVNPGLKGLKLVYGDVCDIDTLRPLVRDVDIIINLAGVIKGLNQKTYDDVNVDGNINMCKAVLEENPKLKRLILTSSLAAVGGGRDKAITEEDDLIVIKGDYYGISKNRMEKAVKPYFKKLNMAIVRPPVVFGPGDLPSLDLYSLAKTGMKLIVGNKPLTYSIVNVFDLIEGIWEMAINDKAIGEIFFFTSGGPTEWGAIQEIIGTRVFGRKYGSLLSLAVPGKITMLLGFIMETVARFTGEVPFVIRPKAIEGMVHWYCSSEKAQRMLNWKPKYNISKTVKQAAEWYMAHDLL